MDKQVYKDFLSIFLCLTVPKKFSRLCFSVPLLSGIEKLYG